jgi:16S rRNA (guanine966-N2)-methyltransferase
VFVESHRRTAALVQANARDLGLEGAEVAARTVQVHLARERAGHERPFDVVFADPPYDVPVAELRDVLTALVRGAWLREGALLAVERSRRSGDLDWPAGVDPISRRPYGDTVLWYGRRCDRPGQPAQD